MQWIDKGYGFVENVWNWYMGIWGDVKNSEPPLKFLIKAIWVLALTAIVVFGIIGLLAFLISIIFKTDKKLSTFIAVGTLAAPFILHIIADIIKSKIEN